MGRLDRSTFSALWQRPLGGQRLSMEDTLVQISDESG
jgi:hypothetical protein